ncbi:hypothetical protein [Propionispora sp. 2/2-37]|nr:hypothetical protein [Propionispora sp. 2/2-37]
MSRHGCDQVVQALQCGSATPWDKNPDGEVSLVYRGDLPVFFIYGGET